jgi:inositol phosphorylceramide mannosyltransferase catalytic subunit
MKYPVEQSSPTWDVVSDLFAINYTESSETESRIPKIIHQIWLGGEVPVKYKKYMDSWRYYHPDWDYKLWTDKDVNDIFITKRSIFEACKNQGMRSDILRYEILRQYGGLYTDTDFECLKPFDDLMYLKFFTGIAYGDVFVLYVGLIACVPNHPIINACVNNLDTPYRGHGGNEVMAATGPYYMTRCFNETVDYDSSGVVVFPVEFFYPMPNTMRGRCNPKHYIKESSYAIHHFDVSWLENN